MTRARGVRRYPSAVAGARRRAGAVLVACMTAATDCDTRHVSLLGKRGKSAAEEIHRANPRSRESQ